MKTVIEMARAAGAVFPADGSYHKFEFEGSLERFAALVRAEALAEPARPYRPLQDNGSKYFGPSWDKADQALNRMADNAKELGLDYEPDGMHHNKPAKRPQNCGTGYCSCIECVMEPAQEPAPLRDAMVANLVREGINKHKARELADHFVVLATAPAWVSLTDEEIDDIYQGVGKNDLMLVREVEAKLREKNT